MELEVRSDDEALEAEQARRSLAYFEDRRLRIVERLVDRLEIPASEFEPGDETAFFHFLTSALAVASWLKDVCEQSYGYEYDDRPAMADAALRRLTASALTRLVLLPSAYGLDDEEDDDGVAERRMAFMAFLSASGVHETCASFVIQSWSIMRGYLVDLARARSSDEFDEPSADFFSAFMEWTENVDSDGFFPRDAVPDACAMLYAEFGFMEDFLPFRANPVDPDASRAEWFAAAKNFLLPCSYRRHALIFDGKSFSREGATFDEAARSFDAGDDPARVLFETVLVGVDESAVLNFYLNEGSGREMMEIAKGAREAGLEPSAVSFGLV